MSDSVSIAFRGEFDSPALYFHWGGRETVKTASSFAARPKETWKDSEPEFVAASFLVYLAKQGIIEGDGDVAIDPDFRSQLISDTDHGHFTIDVDTGHILFE